MQNYCDIMVQSRVRMGAFLASYLSNNGRRTRRSDDGYRPYFDDNRIGIEPSNARGKSRSNQHIVARPTVPHSGGVLRAPDTEKGWTWEDIEGAAEGSIAKPHEVQSFQERFPIANNKAETSVKAEAPNSYAEHHMNSAAVKAVNNEKVERVLPLNVADLANPELSKSQGNPVDPMQRQECKEYKEQSNQTPSASSDWFGSEEQDVDAGLNAAAIKAQNFLNRNGAVKSQITVLSRNAAQIALSSMGIIREKMLPFVSRISGRAYAASVAILSMSTKKKSLIVGANMKRHELVENSLLELDTGQEPVALQEEKVELNSDELKQLKSTQFDAKSDSVTETVDDSHGVVGAVQLTPDSPLPRNDKDRAVIFNPVVHGSETETSADYKVSITHEAPKPNAQNQSALRAVSSHTNYVGVIVRALFTIVSVAILILLGFIGYAAFTGNAPSTTDIVTDTANTNALVPTISDDFVEQPSAFITQDRLNIGEIKELESMLTQLGIATGPIDGLVDDATRMAVQEFEVIMGYPATDGTVTKFIQGEIRGVTFERFGFQ